MSYFVLVALRQFCQNIFMSLIGYVGIVVAYIIFAKHSSFVADIKTERPLLLEIAYNNATTSLSLPLLLSGRFLRQTEIWRCLTASDGRSG